MKINKNVIESQNFIRFLENEKNNIIYLKYVCEPSEKNAIELNEAYKKFERQLMVRAYLKKAIYYEAKRFDQKVRSKEQINISIDKNLDDGTTLRDFLIDEKNIRTYEEMWDTKLEEIFENIRLHHAINNLTCKQKKNLISVVYKGIKRKRRCESVRSNSTSDF
ncbi:hypothetical protein L0P96_12425 [Anoxybacillus flavithermus]